MRGILGMTRRKKTWYWSIWWRTAKFFYLYQINWWLKRHYGNEGMTDKELVDKMWGEDV